MIYWVWLTTVPFIGAVTANKLLKKYRYPEKVYQAERQELENIPGMTRKQIDSILSSRSLDMAEKILENCDRHNISILTQEDPNYLLKAREPQDAPILLYYRGGAFPKEQTVGIVGARRCSQEAKQKAIALTEKCVAKKMTIISGMAKGIDSYAHTACLYAGGSTIAILGNGLDICYPSEHRKLMECIMEKGLILSEYPPGTLPAQYRFPKRNRLISAWSDLLYVIAPGKGSGALITAEYEKSYGRKVHII